jgi:uncharacterized protein YdaU (DUF1376 family)
MSAPYYRMFPREWDDGTACLTLEQEGALLRVCNTINSRGQCLPDTDETDREMMHRCRVSMRRWKAIKSALVAAGKITIKDGKIYQARALSEVAYRAEIAENGAKGGRKRAENLSKTARKPVENDAADSKNNSLPQANQNQNQNQNQIDTNVSKARKRASRLPEDWQIPEEWIDEAVSRGLTRARAYAEAERMRNWSQSSPNGAKVKWLAVWRNWIADKADQPAKPAQPADRHLAAAASRRDAWLDVIDEIEGQGASGDNWQPASPASPARLSGPRGSYDGSG